MARIQAIVNEVESLDTINSVEAYPADYDMSSPDIIVPDEDDHERIIPIIESHLGDGERCLRMTGGSYMIYEPLGEIVETHGSTFHILGYNDSYIEAVLVEPCEDEVSPTGDVMLFDTYDTDYEVELFDD